MNFDLTEGRQGASVAPSRKLSAGQRGTLGTVDIVVLVVYFVLILAVGFWVSKSKHFYIVGHST